MTYNELMQQPGKKISPNVYYFFEGEKVEFSHDDITLAKPFFNATLVGTVMKGLELELSQKLPDTAIYFENTASYGADSASKTIGPYYLKETPEFNADSKTYTHKLYDEFISTMKPYKPITITYPCELINFFQRLCVECGFTTDITTLPNGNRILDHDIYDSIGFTYRSVFDDIGQATGTLFTLNAKNIEKCSLGKTDISINDDILKNQNITLGEHFGPINSVVISRAAEADNIYKRDESLTTWNEFKICDNQLMNDNNRSEYLDELYEALYGIEYDIFDLELVGYGGFEPLQRIEINTDNKSYSSYVFNDEESYTQGYTESIYTDLPSEATTDYTKADKTDWRINQTYIIADKQNQKIEAVIQKVDDQNTQLSSLTMQTDQIEATVQETKTAVDELEKATSKFSVDLDTYNLNIVVDSDNKPITTNDYIVNFYSYFSGKQVQANVQVSNELAGITTTVGEDNVAFSVSPNHAVSNNVNEFILSFSYKNGEDTYSLSKKVIVTTTTSGADGKSAYEIWLEAGNTGTEDDYLASLKGQDGTPGQDGTSSYFYVRYSSQSDGSNMTTSPEEDTKYMGVASTTSPTAPTSASAYTWSKIVGNDGAQGIPGADGTSSYFHIKWSEDGSTFTPAQGSTPAGKTPAKWQGTYVDTNETDSEVFEDYNWVDTSIVVTDELNAMRSDLNATQSDLGNIATDLQNNYLTSDQINAINSHNEEELTKLKEQFANIEYTSSEVELQIGNILTDGVNKITTSTGFTFDENGLDISKTGEEMHNFMNNIGVYIMRDNEEVLGADASGVRAENITVRKYLMIGKNSRIEDYEDTRTGVFFVGE